MFTESGSGWVQSARLTATDSVPVDSFFGVSVAISGDTIVVGDCYAANNDNGAAYVFTKPASGWTDMTQNAELIASNGVAGDQFGISVAISGNLIAVGAFNATVGANYQEGEAYLFVKPTSGWTNMTQAPIPDAGGLDGDFFGYSVSVDGSTAVVGAPENGDQDWPTPPDNGGGGDTGGDSPNPPSPDPGGWGNNGGGNDFPYAALAAGTARPVTAGIAKPIAANAIADIRQGTVFVYENINLTPPASRTCDPSTNRDWCYTLVRLDKGRHGCHDQRYGIHRRNAGELRLDCGDQPNGQCSGHANHSDKPGWSRRRQRDGDNPRWSLGCRDRRQVYLHPAPTVAYLYLSSGPAKGGTAVTIAGTGFTGATQVNFGANAATNVLVNTSGTLITATSPAGTGIVNVTVTGPGGTSAAVAFDQFTYVAAPTVASVTPSSGPAKGGTVVTIKGTGFTAGVTCDKRILRAKAAINVSVNAAGTLITAMSPAGTGVVNVTVTGTGGTSAITAADLFTYIAAPTVTGVAPSSGSTRGGTVVTIRGTGFTGETLVSFGTKAATNVMINAAGTLITATSPAGTGIVNVTVTGCNGTSALSIFDFFTYK